MSKILDMETIEAENNVHDYAKRTPLMVNRTGWGLFNEELAWFLYDFFKIKLNGYEKLIFFSYYINGMTMEEIGNSSNKTIQAISLEIIKINKKLSHTWKTRETWKVAQNDSCREDKRSSGRDKKRSRSRRRS